MNNDIKEILDNVKKCCDITKDQSFTVYQRQDILALLDYITNLQEKYEEADNDRHKLFEQKEKAIEMFNNDTLNKYYYGMSYEFEINDFKEDMLNILKGEKNE